MWCCGCGDVGEVTRVVSTGGSGYNEGVGGQRVQVNMCDT